MWKVSLPNGLRHFSGHDGGNVAGIFALSFLPLLAMVGAAVDFGQFTDARSAMKQAADSTAVSLVNAATTSTAAQLQTAGSNYFAANMPTSVNNLVVTSSYNTSTSEITVTATADVPLSIMQALNMPTLTTSVTSKVTFGSSRLRVALALDNTGSMADSGKMAALQTATNNLLTQLKTAGSGSGDVYVSIIPFNRDVNIGSSNYTQSWLDWTDWNSNSGSCADSRGRSKAYYTQNSCQQVGYIWTADSKSSWNGCIEDRAQNYDTTASAPSSGVTATYFPPDQYGSCPLQMMGLSTNFDGMTTLVNSMYPNGNTNQAIGFVWAWQSLVGGGPLVAPVMDPNYQYQNIIILVSDGLNTQDRWYTDANSIDARQKIACDNAKAAGITIYTVQVNTGGDPDSAVLGYCASSGDKFSILTSADQIVTTFNSIGVGLNKVRISQ